MTDKKALVPVQHEVVSIVQNQIKITEKIITSLVRKTCENNKYGISCLTDIRKAAEQGDVNAQCRLGQMYRLGEGVPLDDVEAAKWFCKAAEQGDLYAQGIMGWLYRCGEGVPQDDAEAGNWYRKAADQGLADAQFWLGVMYRCGQGGVQKDDVEAAKWFRKAAEQGNKDAQLKLDEMKDK